MRALLENSDRIVASPSGNHFFTFRPDWTGTAPLPFRAAAATVELLSNTAPKILILGFGMGAMGSMMQERRPHSQITGVEPDRRLYKAALDALENGSHPSAQERTPIKLHRADAVSFLRRSKDTFDLVLDDCFIEIVNEVGDSEPYRPPKLEVLPELAKARLAQGGIYARNLLGQEGMSLDHQRGGILRHFKSTCERAFRDWDNVLIVAADYELNEEVVAKLGN